MDAILMYLYEGQLVAFPNCVRARQLTVKQKHVGLQGPDKP